MSGAPRSVERLRRAFAADEGPAIPDDACPGPERIWDAAHARLAHPEARAIVRHVAECPACAADWRLAMEDPARTADAVPARHGATLGWLAAAAAAAALAFVAWVGVRPPRDVVPAPSFREARTDEIASLVPDGATLPRDGAVLRWSAAGTGARYRLELSLDDLTPLAVEHDLTDTSWEIPPEVLARVPPGSAVVWRVEARLPDGRIAGSPAFVSRIE